MFVSSGSTSITTSSFTSCQSSGGVSRDQKENLRCIAPWICTWAVLDHAAGDECCRWPKGPGRGCGIHMMCTATPMLTGETDVRMVEAQCLDGLAM